MEYVDVDRFRVPLKIDISKKLSAITSSNTFQDILNDKVSHQTNIPRFLKTKLEVKWQRLSQI